jgi:copper transporter 1
VLFKGWVIEVGWNAIMTCLSFYVLALLYEGLKCYREHLLKRASRPSFAPIAVITSLAEDSPNNPGSGDSLQPRMDGNRRNMSPICRMLCWPHVLQSGLHVVQVALSYVLMLGFMTFNGWICLSVLLGAGSGYFLFCWRKMVILDVTEHCH